MNGIEKLQEAIEKFRKATEEGFKILENELKNSGSAQEKPSTGYLKAERPIRCSMCNKTIQKCTCDFPF